MGEEVKAPTATNDRVCAASKRYIEDELDEDKRNRPVLELFIIINILIVLF